jgi:hypothetical protein
VEEQRALADTPGAYERNTLPVAEQAKDFTDLWFTTVEILRPPNGATVKERILYAHNAFIVMPKGRSAKLKSLAQLTLALLARSGFSFLEITV